MGATIADFLETCSFPYLHGVMLAINGIRDAYLLVDAPSCNFFRAEQVFGFHDVRSTLIDVSSRHRAISTDAHIDRLIEGGFEGFSTLLARLVEAPFVGAVFHTASPVTSIIGTPHDDIAREVAPAPGKPVVGMPDRTLRGDWLDGFEDVLTALAGAIPMEAGRTDPRKVAVIGLRVDRNEEDHLGNLREVARLLSAIGLDVVTAWPGDEDVASMARVEEAGLLIAFPAGYAAARKLAGRTGATVLDCEIPFGPAATDRWLMAVGQAIGNADGARAVISAEADRWVPMLKWLVPKRFLDSRWAFAGLPELMPGFREIADLVGAEVTDLVAWSSRTVPDPVAGGMPVPIRTGLTRGHLADVQAGLPEVADLAVGNSIFVEGLRRRLPCLEFGFPCHGRHALYDSPFLGYRGFLWLAQRLAELLPDALRAT